MTVVVGEDVTAGAWIALAAVVVALALGLWRLATDGRFRGTRAVPRIRGDVPAYQGFTVR